MRFPFDISDLLPDSAVTVVSSDCLPINKFDKRFYQYTTIIDSLGLSSAKAQFLKAPVTTFPKLVGNPDQKLYILKEDVSNANAIGFLKIGTKKLFLQDQKNRMLQVAPLCVLDFYIDECFQRQGFGKSLFEYFLKVENKHPKDLAYDRPSPKFLAFLRKHFNLHSYVPQNNNFVVFHEFGLNSIPENSSPKTKTSLDKLVSKIGDGDISRVADMVDSARITIPKTLWQSSRKMIPTSQLYPAGIKSDRDRFQTDFIGYGKHTI